MQQKYLQQKKQKHKNNLQISQQANVQEKKLANYQISNNESIRHFNKADFI
jgi:hypothetical protein